jgi:hypothetical protein
MYLYFKRQEFLNSENFVCFTQLFYESQHYDPVRSCEVSFTSSLLRWEQSEFVVFSNVQTPWYINFLFKKKPKFLHSVASPNLTWREGSNIYFYICTTKSQYFSSYGCIFLKIYPLAVDIQEMKVMFQNLIFMWVTKDLLTSFNFYHK